MKEIEIEARLKSMEQKINSITNELIIEKTRNEIYREIISNNTSIILTEKGLKVSNQPPPQIKQPTPPSPQIKQPKPTPPQIKQPKPIDDIPFLSLNSDDEAKDDSIDQIAKINDVIERIKNSKNIQAKNNTELKKYRKVLFTTMKLNEYIDICNSHVSILTEIFKEKGVPDKKIITTIRSILTPMDLRLLKYDGYVNSHVGIDEIQSLQNRLDNLTPSCQEYKLLDTDNICESMYNYGSVLFPVQINLKRVLFNNNKVNNLIYLQLDTSSKADPFSFYYLSEIKRNKRHWKMDCRLEDLTYSITNNMVPYMINNFRKMYHDVFGDNDYRPDYKSKCQLTDCDCNQLVKNVLILADPKAASKLIRNLVRTNSTYTPDNNDIFNIYSDDALQKTQFTKHNKDHLTDIPKRLFDTISADEVIKFSESL